MTGYEGHCSLTPEHDLRLAKERAAMAFFIEVAELLEREGLPCPIRSAGGTATWDWTAAYPGDDRDPGRDLRRHGQLPRPDGRRASSTR